MDQITPQNAKVYIEQSLNPQNYRQGMVAGIYNVETALSKQTAEERLQTMQLSPGFPLILLQIIASDEKLPIRQGAALLLKNLVKKSWQPDEDNAMRLSESDRLSVKKDIVSLMIGVPPVLQSQLGEAISVIADYDFPHDWQNLINDLVAKLTPNETAINLGVLQTAHSIFKRWRAQVESNELFKEIKYVLELFCSPYLSLVLQTDSMIAQFSHDLKQLESQFDLLFVLLKIYIDFNCQDIPEFFEDHLNEFTTIFHKYLGYNNPLLNSNSDDDTSVQDKVKAVICEIIELYALRYEDVFPMLPQFVTSVWQLLMMTGPETKHDILVSKALGFLTSVTKIPRHASLFNDEGTLKQVVERVVLPSMSFRELFEDEPIEFIRRDLEGSDTDTRRRSASEFVKALLEPLEVQLYSADKNNWRAKDTAIYFLISVAAKSTISQFGVTSTNLLIDVVDFFNANIFSELTDSATNNPLIIVDAIKYIYIFRNQLLLEQIKNSLPLLICQLEPSNYVKYTYSAIAIERLLCLRHDDVLIWNHTELLPLAAEILERSFALINLGNTPEKLSENDYLMRCEFLDINKKIKAIDELQMILEKILRNPSNPKFNHYLFESLAVIIRSGQQSCFYERLYPMLFTILQDDVAEFIPYALQIIAQIIETLNCIPEPFTQLLTPLLTPLPWNVQGNIPPLVRVLQAFLKVDGEIVLRNKCLQSLLGVFQKLISSKRQDHLGLQLLEYIYTFLPFNEISPYSRQIFFLLISRLNNSKTDKFCACLTTFFWSQCVQNDLYVSHHIINCINQIQEGSFPTILSSVLLPYTIKITNLRKRKLVAVGLTNIICHPDIFINGPLYMEAWSEMLQALLRLLETSYIFPENDVCIGDAVREVEDVEFQANYSRLTMSTTFREDQVSKITNIRTYFVEQLEKLKSRGELQLLLKHGTGIPAETIELLKAYGIRL